MATNLTIEAPDFDRIERGDGRATADAVRLLYDALNAEASFRRRSVKAVGDRFEKAVLTASPSAGQNDYDPAGAAILRFDGSSSVNLTGIRAGVEGTLVFVVVLGTGTITIKNDSASSEAINRILTYSAGDLAVATNQAVLLLYTDSRWREVSWA